MVAVQLPWARSRRCIPQFSLTHQPQRKCNPKCKPKLHIFSTPLHQNPLPVTTANTNTTYPEATTAHTARPEAAQPGLAGRVHPKFTATITKFKTEMVKNAPSEPLAKALAQAQGGERDSTGEEGLRGAVQPPPTPASATSNPTQLEPPPTPSQQQESTWCPTHTTDIALGFTKQVIHCH